MEKPEADRKTHQYRASWLVITIIIWMTVALTKGFFINRNFNFHKCNAPPLFGRARPDDTVGRGMG